MRDVGVLQLCVETKGCWHILQTQTPPLQAQNTRCATTWNTQDNVNVLHTAFTFIHMHTCTQERVI